MTTYRNFGSLQPIVEDIVNVVAEYSHKAENIKDFYASDIDKAYADLELGECFHCIINTKYLGVPFKIAEVSAISLEVTKYPPRNFEFSRDFYSMYRFRKTNEKCYLYKAVFVNNALQGYVRHEKQNSYGVSMIKFLTDNHTIPKVSKKAVEVTEDYAVEEHDSDEHRDVYSVHSKYPLWDELNLAMDPDDYIDTEYSMESSLQNVFTSKSLITKLVKCGLKTMGDIFSNNSEYYEVELGSKLLPDFYTQLDNTYN